MATAIATAYVTIAPEIKNFASAIRSQLGGDAQAAGAEAGHSFSSGMGKALAVASGAIVAAGTALAGMGAFAVKAGAEFEAGMSRVEAISGATKEELEQLNEQAKQLGADTAFSASEAAAGMENLASAGFSASEMMSAMPGLLDLAAVSGGNVAAASDVAASALRAFGLDASEAGHVADVFAKAAADTNAEALDMGEAMKYVAPVAHSMGISIEEAAAAVGIMSDAGIKGGQAGTALRGALARLAKPTKQMSETMSELGLNFYDTNGKMLPLNDQVGMLQDSFKDLSEQEKNHALVSLYGQESLSGMMTLIDAGPEKLDVLTSSLESSDGAAAAMAATINDNLKGKLDGLSGSIETLSIEFYQSVNTGLGTAVELADGYIGRLTDAFRSGGISGIASELGAVIADAITQISAKAPELIETGVSVIQNLITGIAKNVPQISASIIQAASSLVIGIIDILPMLIDLGVQLVISLALGLSEMLPELIPTLIDGVLAMVNALLANLGPLISAGIELLLALVFGIIDAIPQLVEAIPTIIATVVTTLVEKLPEIIAAGWQLLIALIGGIIDAIPELLLMGPKIMKSLIDSIIEKFEEIKDTGKDLVRGLWEGILNSIDWLKEKITGWVGNVLSFIKGLFGIKSPSKEMAKIGNYVSQGLAKGIEDDKGYVERAVADLVDIPLGMSIPVGSPNFSKMAKAAPDTTSAYLADMIDRLERVLSNIRIYLDRREVGRVFVETA